MAVVDLKTNKGLLPQEVALPMIKNAQDTSVLARLSGQNPMRFGEEKYITFTETPKAEFVEESGEKSASNAAFGTLTASTHKAQVTVRVSDEFLWADEDYQLGMLSALEEAGGIALGRALDLGAIHRINPLTGTPISTWTDYLAGTTKKVEQGPADPDDDLRTAVGMLLNGTPSTPVTGAAFSRSFAWALANLKRKDGTGQTSDLRYPQLGFGVNITDFGGMPVAVADTVSGQPEAADTKVRAIVGDFQDGFKWGVKRQLPLELIRYGDPDGQGDLARKNQVALRLEIVYGWAILKDRFALVADEA